MNKDVEKSLWVTSVQPEVIEGDTYVPTAVCVLDSKQVKIGRSAKAEQENEKIINDNFKLSLGNVISGGSVENRKLYETESGIKRNAYELTKAYFDKLLVDIERKVPRSEKTNYKHPAKIIIAEPLSFQVEGYTQQWISNYRKNIRKILDRYEEVEFLPEPFAVYQYYRYGLRIPSLQSRSKQVAFIIDFGGGTFDACIIESTHAGDISLSGKSSKPLSADSTPIGGNYVNEEISSYLIKKNVSDSRKGDADRYVKQYRRTVKGDLELNDLKPEAQIFIGNFIALLSRVERYKIDLASRISNWSLKISIYEKIMVSIPINPFIGTETVDTEFYDHQLREIVIHEIWSKKLKKIVRNVLDRSKESLGDKQITTTLISGGSSNLRWLEKLLIQDFSIELEDAEPVPINHSFQEIVANGLAIECARRYFTNESEFVAVTYNPIKLYLSPDDETVRKDLRFKSLGEKIDMKQASPGDLIPSAQSLKHFFDENISWRVKLKKSPKNCLNYYFSRPESDENDHYNVEETKINTSDSKHFDSYVVIDVVVKEDGTFCPKFIYKTANAEFNVEENSEIGRPFYIDMTTDSYEDVVLEHYIGLDFGTSNSSVCLLNQEQIKLTKNRQELKSWKGLSNSVDKLPYPVAFSIRKFLSAFDKNDSANAAREAFESTLAFMAYVAASEAASHEVLGDAMNHYQHRSMGPLRALLSTSLTYLGSNAHYSKGFKPLFDKHNEALGKAIDDFNDHKHDKLDAGEVNWHEHVELVVKVLLMGLEGFSFGYCSTSDQAAFTSNSFEGVFITAHDNAPFIKSSQYSSTSNINSSIALILDNNTNKALSLTPFIFWFSRESNTLPHGCFWIDKRDKNEPVVKPIDEKKCHGASALNDGLKKIINELYDDGVTMVGEVEVSLNESLEMSND